MSILNRMEKNAIKKQPTPFGMADQIVNGIADYDFDLGSVKSYDERVKDEIVSGILDLRNIKKLRTRPTKWTSEGRRKELAVRGEQIVGVLPTNSVEVRAFRGAVTDCGDALVTPGFIDCHTHLVWGGTRAAEWEMPGCSRRF